MKKIILIVAFLNLIACNNEPSATDTAKTTAPKSQKEAKSPTPQTITLKEVSRIALVEAKQFLDNQKGAGKAVPQTILDIYNQAKEMFDNGEYKKAQKLAVQVRQGIETIKMSNK